MDDLAITALHHIRSLRGHTKPHMMLCDDGNSYVVKFHCNSQAARGLACDYLASKLAEWTGLPAPSCSVVNVCHFLVDNTKDLSSVLHREDRSLPELHFGSRLIGNCEGDRVVDVLPDSYIQNSVTSYPFGGMLVFDKWTSNTDARQALFLRRRGAAYYDTYFVDQSHCFGGSDWTLSLTTDGALFQRRFVYQNIRGWESFEPFMERLLSASPGVIWGFAQEIPPAWYGNRRDDLEALVENLLCRRLYIHDLIAKQRDAMPGLFPLWSRRSTVYVPAPLSATLGLTHTHAEGQALV